MVRPASFCGVAGFKPTFGLLPLGGAMAFAPTSDHVSLFAATSADIDFAWQSIGFKSHGEPAKAVTAALDGDTVPTWVVAPYRGRISIISGAFACRYDGPASRRTFATGS